MHQTLSIHHLAKSFGPLTIFEDISLTVSKGEFVSLIGPSGCGKSTLFHILAGVENATSGELLFDKKVIKDSRGEFGYMPQELSLFPWKTVLENVMIGLCIKGIKKSIAEVKAKELLKKFGLLEFGNNYPATLSGGMQQRVALLRTVLFHPSFLLLDEPFGSLDALTRQTAQLWLLDVCKTFGSSVLFITHDIQEAILLSDRIYVFGNRPAEIVKEVQVNIHRPRKLIDLTGSQAITLEKKLLSLLQKTKK
jgi:ABC-type nitrate/sulfonate/bicarbonate transport system ATPase subunit